MTRRVKSVRRDTPNADGRKTVTHAHLECGHEQLFVDPRGFGLGIDSFRLAIPEMGGSAYCGECASGSAA